MANSSSGSQRLSPWQHNLLPALVTASSCGHTWPPRLKLDGAHRPVAGLGTWQGSTAQSAQAGNEPEPREGARRAQTSLQGAALRSVRESPQQSQHMGRAVTEVVTPEPQSCVGSQGVGRGP